MNTQHMLGSLSLSLALLAGTNAIAGPSAVAAPMPSEAQTFRMENVGTIGTRDVSVFEAWSVQEPTLRTDMSVQTTVPATGTSELWELSYEVLQGTGLQVSANLNGSFAFEIFSTIQNGVLTLRLDTIYGSVEVNEYSTQRQWSNYQALLASVEDELAFIEGTVQLARNDPGLPRGSSASVDCDQACTDAMGITPGVGPKPEDCEGAIDEYLCCIWETIKDNCVCQCWCQDATFPRACQWSLCTLGSGVDGVACVIGLPLPG